MNFFWSQILFLSTLFGIFQPATFKSGHLLAPARPPDTKSSYAETEYDWNGDGRPDHFRLRVHTEIEPLVEGLEQAPSKHQHWSYHCWLVVESGLDNSSLWEDEWSVKESDMTSFRQILDFGFPENFFRNWFTWKFGREHNQDLDLNYFEVRQLEDREVDEDVLASEMKRLKIEEIAPQELKREIVEDKSSRIFVYRGSNREDIRWAIYIPHLRKVIMFQRGFAD
jgi:hypothetical protein